MISSPSLDYPRLSIYMLGALNGYGVFHIYSEEISLATLISEKSILVPLYHNHKLHSMRYKAAEVRLLYLKERFSFKFELKRNGKRTRNSVTDSFVCSTISESTSSVHLLKHNSILDSFQPNSESNVFYIHPAEVREPFLIEKMQRKLDSPISFFKSSTKEFLSHLYNGESTFPMKNAAGDISGQMKIENFEILYHLGIDDYLPYMEIHFDYAIDFSENSEVQSKRLSSVFKVLTASTMLQIGKLNQGLVKLKEMLTHSVLILRLQTKKLF